MPTGRGGGKVYKISVSNTSKPVKSTISEWFSAYLPTMEEITDYLKEGLTVNIVPIQQKENNGGI